MLLISHISPTSFLSMAKNSHRIKTILLQKINQDLCYCTLKKNILSNDGNLKKIKKILNLEQYHPCARIVYMLSRIMNIKLTLSIHGHLKHKKLRKKQDISYSQA